MPNPETGAGFDAPTPEAAYRVAPDPLQEALALMRISTDLTVAQATGEEGERLYLLRRAALADRMAIAEPDVQEYQQDAVELSQALAKFDREHRHLVSGPHGPDSIEWDPSARPYVRQEYDARGW
ncbi:hypothetical protein HRW18_16065 [Streptomyces lunaelactis]|uniref:hypothetical protein n=1 Tax=Streptomyces lunaelactis TaxID=1535768 RepID=UPI001585C3AB|nr:hypothetical protein [Streptomyces lunaelactis]NUK09492.1 hypothetical protein [Streptomyces lunaelactis]NUK73369.1 hypothetical protein [Streptomyces lunaelactis]NUL10924.1 hypothetical protein [Streptomyces lunaelactis]NUL24516.1 hypothetical protein [Streptomyces lunaelactis]